MVHGLPESQASNAAMIYTSLLLWGVEVENAKDAPNYFYPKWGEIYFDTLFGSSGWLCWNFSLFPVAVVVDGRST